MENKNRKNCESCLFPLSKDPGVSGSEKYCSYCFKDGKLVYEGSDLKEFQNRSYQEMIKKGMNKYQAKFFTWMMHFAPRWKK
ncbi:MAG: zinc ribbon domain-containing protein [Candidatus Parcubacteria bacterium]|nr:zinc ribbon domain-containing protein [Candidatus Parcubacteria bacterium]